MQIDSAIVKRLESLMIMYKTNPNKLANDAGIPASTITSILYGKSHNPGVATIQLICDVFHISLSEFFSSEEFESLNTPD